MMRILFSSILIVLLGCTNPLIAQRVNVTQEIDGKTYYMHLVEPGHTLYGISRIYHVEVEDIIEANPTVVEGLKVGETLKVPAASSREVEKITNPVRMEGDKLVHRVLKGETLFGISKEYNVDVNTILELNPDANAGLKKGMELSIPMNKVVVDDLSDIQPAAEDSLMRHLVQPGETLYAIAKLYQVEVKAIQDVNGGLPEGLKAGSYIRIPKVNEKFELQTQEIEFKPEVRDTQPVKDRYQIAFMLPFYLSSKDSSLDARSLKLREISLSMWRGALVGLDSLKSEGLFADVRVKDVYDNPSLQRNFQKDPEMQRNHLVVGPLQRSLLETMLETPGSDRTHVVCPVPQSNKVLLGHENLSKVNSSDHSEWEALAAFVASHHGGDNLIILNTGFTDDIKRVESFRTKLNLYLQDTSNKHPLLITEHRCEGKSVGGLRSKLNPSVRNVIIALTENEVVIADLMTKLGLTDRESYQVMLYGTEAWNGMRILDPEAMERFNLHVPASQYFDRISPEGVEFIRAYREKFETDPDEYAALGYDIIRFYGKGLLRFGTAFPAHFNEIDYSALTLNFEMKKTGLESGFENKHVYVLEFSDYAFKIAK